LLTSVMVVGNISRIDIDMLWLMKTVQFLIDWVLINHGECRSDYHLLLSPCSLPTTFRPYPAGSNGCCLPLRGWGNAGISCAYNLRRVIVCSLAHFVHGSELVVDSFFSIIVEWCSWECIHTISCSLKDSWIDLMSIWWRENSPHDLHSPKMDWKIGQTRSFTNLPIPQLAWAYQRWQIPYNFSTRNKRWTDSWNSRYVK